MWEGSWVIGQGKFACRAGAISKKRMCFLGLGGGGGEGGCGYGNIDLSICTSVYTQKIISSILSSPPFHSFSTSVHFYHLFSYKVLEYNKGYFIKI